MLRVDRAQPLGDPFLMVDDSTLRDGYLRRLKWGTVLLVILAVPAIIHSHAAINGLVNHPADWVPDSTPEKQAFNEFARLFSGTELVMLTWPGADLESQELDRVAAKLNQLTSHPPDVDAPPDVDSVDQAETGANFQTLKQTAGTEAPFIWVRTGSEMLQRLQQSPLNLKRSAAVKRLQGSMVGDDGQRTTLLVALSESSRAERRWVLPELQSLIAEEVGQPTDQIVLVGGMVDGATVDSASVRSIQTFSPPSGILAGILCFLCLRSIPLTAVVTTVALVGEGLVLAAVYYSGTPMNAVLIVLPPLVFVLTVSAGIHLSNYYMDAAHEFADLSSARSARRAMRVGVTPSLLATGTTVVGLGSLMLVRLEPIRVFGAVASFGVLTTIGLLILLLPGAMVLTKVDPQRPDWMHDLMHRLAVTADRRRGIAKWYRRRLERPWPAIG
ncbi:MAG: MMPL family transporter, partial [Planctomycetota bacterium]